MSSPLQNNITNLQNLLEQVNALPEEVILPKLANPADASKALSGYEFINEDCEKVTGIIPTKTASDLTASGATVTVPAGYYATQAAKSVATATQATPTISIDSAGKITATATQTAGYVAAGTKTGTKQLTTQAAKTVTPSTSEQTAVASGVYTTGAVKVAAIPSKYVDNSTVTATEADVLSGKKFGSTNSVKTGSMANNGAVSKTLDGVTTKSVTIPAGYTSGGTVSMDGTVDNAVTAALSALVEKGVEVPEGTNVTGLADLIAAIEAGGGKFATTTLVPAEDVATTSGSYFEHGLGVIPNFMVFLSPDLDKSVTGQRYIKFACLYCYDIDDVTTYIGTRIVKTNASTTYFSASSHTNGDYNLNDLNHSGSNHMFRATETYINCKGQYGVNNTYLNAGKNYIWVVAHI